jgi:Lon protease-like protein
MTRSVFDPEFDELPKAICVFPLEGALLLPGGRLPLRIFETRYLNMVEDALAGDRLIGMVQPCEESEEQGSAKVYRTGCVGRITAFNETDEGHYLITLFGLIRFTIDDELPPHRGYRRVVPSFERFRADIDEDTGRIDRVGLLDALSRYFESNGIEGDWDAIEETPDEKLVTSLAMICPFEPPEKQALLEAPTLPERAATMTAILRMSAHERDAQAPRH